MCIIHKSLRENVLCNRVFWNILFHVTRADEKRTLQIIIGCLTRSVINQKGNLTSGLTCSQYHARADGQEPVGTDPCRPRSVGVDTSTKCSTRFHLRPSERTWAFSAGCAAQAKVRLPHTLLSRPHSQAQNEMLLLTSTTPLSGWNLLMFPNLALLQNSVCSCMSDVLLEVSLSSRASANKC